MKRKNEAHELVLQCLTEALLKLMEKKPFNEINVSELCEKAGVARASFYRNYDYAGNFDKLSFQRYR